MTIKDLAKKARLLDKLFKTVKVIEEEGIGGIQTAILIGGKNMALALLITHLRRELGSMNSFPADTKIDDEVLKILVDHKLA